MSKPKSMEQIPSTIEKYEKPIEPTIDPNFTFSQPFAPKNSLEAEDEAENA